MAGEAIVVGLGDDRCVFLMFDRPLRADTSRAQSPALAERSTFFNKYVLFPLVYFDLAKDKCYTF